MRGSKNATRQGWLSRFLAGEGGLSPLVTALFIAAPVVLAALFYVWTHVTTVQLGYALSKSSKVHRRLLEENRGLRIEVAALRAPERLTRLARKDYALAAPRSEQVIRANSAEAR